MYRLRMCFHNLKEAPYTVLRLFLNANEDVIIKDTQSILKTKTIGNNYYLLSEYNRITHKYNYIKIFKKSN